MQNNEEEILKYVGDCIRLYRRKRGLTVTELAKRIYKSKATVSKYEKGQIAVDIVTLHMIANALGVSIEELTDFASQNNSEETFWEQERFFYMYTLSTSTSKVVTSVIRILFRHTLEAKICSATLYYDVVSADRWQECDHIYRGTADFSEYVTTFNLRNCVWNQEHLHIILSTPLKADKAYQGIILGLSSTTILPTMSKASVMTKPLSSSECMREILQFSKTEMNYIKKYGTFSWNRNI